MASGHEFDGANRPQPLERFQSVPAGGQSSTVTDMARFMLAHLGNGRHDGAQILQPATAAMMHQQQFTNAPDVPGMAYGFYENTRNGQRLLVHDGDTLLFHTQLALLPEHGIGLYVAYNGSGEEPATAKPDIREELQQAVLDHLWPAAAQPPSASSPTVTDSTKFAGSYLVTRSNVSTVEKVASLNQLAITTGPNGTLRTPAGQVGSDPANDTTWEPIGPLLFRETGGQRLLAFRANKAGAIDYVFESGEPFLGYQRVSWWQNATLHQGVAAAGVGVLLLTLLVWPLTALVIRLRRRKTGSQPPRRPARWARRIAWATCLLTVAFLMALALLLADGQATALRGPSPRLWTPVIRGASLGLATMALTVTGILVWTKRLWRIPGRIGYTLIVLAALSLTTVVTYYNLANLPLNS